MNTKQKISFFVFPIIIVILFIITNAVFSFNYSAEDLRIQFYYNETEDSLDTIFIGPSTMRAGIIPTEAYEQTGMTSYVYAINGAPLITVKYMIEEALKTQEPKLIVVEINSITNSSQELIENRSDVFVNNIKNSETKKQAREEIFEEYSIENDLPIISNHYNWTSLGNYFKYKNVYQRRKNEPTYLKGYTTFNNDILEIKDEDIIRDFYFNESSKTNNGNGNNKEEVLTQKELKPLKDLLNYAKKVEKEHNLKILFMRMPKFTLNETAMIENKKVKYAGDYILKKGFDYIDFSQFLFNGNEVEGSELGINPKTDYSDNFHLNQLGAEKFTNYIATYIDEKYNFTYSHSKEVKDHWNTITKETKQYYQDLKDATLNGNLFIGCELDFCKKYDK